MIRIGEITYANCLPIFAALRKLAPRSDYTYVQGEPTTLNRFLFEGQIDLAPSSSFEYGLHPDQYLLIPNLSISSGQEIQSVLLFSRVPIEGLQGKRVLFSPASASSNALIQILLEKRYGLKPVYGFAGGEGSRIPEGWDARIAIGNPALRAYLSTMEDVQVYDLSVLWREYTGLPFVFALWLVRREAAEKQEQDVRRLAAWLQEANEYAQSHFAELAEEFETSLQLPAASLVRYWQSISFDLDKEKIESLTRYYAYAEELALIPENPPLHFFPAF
jgi:chorismate dehydratase